MKQAWKQANQTPLNLHDATGIAIMTKDNLQEARLAFQGEANSSLLPPPPLLIVHGVEIYASDVDREAALLADLTGAHVQSMEYAPGVVTYFTPLDDQLHALCDRLRVHHIFGTSRELDVLGHSSGAILARAVAQNVHSCLGRNNVRIRHYVGIAGPQQGVIAGIPGPTGIRLAHRPWLGPLIVKIAQWSWTQQYIVSTASYLYDPRFPDDCVSTNFGPSSFIGRLNQGWLLDDPQDSLYHLSSGYDHPSSDPIIASTTKNSLKSLSGNVLLIASMDDEVIRPPQSAFFSRAVAVPKNWNPSDTLGPSPDPEQLHPVCNTDLWHQDTIGLQFLWDQRRVFVYRSPTHHGPLPTNEYVNLVAPFLRGEVGRNAEAGHHSTSATAEVVLESICHGQTEMQVIVL